MEQKLKELENKVLFLERVVDILVAKHKKINIPIELAENKLSIGIGKNIDTAYVKTLEQGIFLRKLFVGKVSEIIGVDKTTELFKECNDIMKAHFKIDDSKIIEKESIEFTEKKLKSVNTLLSEDYKTGFKECIEKYLTENPSTMYHKTM